MGSPVVVTGSIAPMRADRLRNLDKFSVQEDSPTTDPVTGTVTATVPLPTPSHLHALRLVSTSPLIVHQSTLDYAVECAQRVISIQGQMEVNETSTAMLALAYSVMHHYNVSVKEKR